MQKIPEAKIYPPEENRNKISIQFDERYDVFLNELANLTTDNIPFVDNHFDVVIFSDACLCFNMSTGSALPKFHSNCMC